MTTKPNLPPDADDDQYDGYDDEPECPNCHGEGRDPHSDYLLPCPLCQGEQTL